MVIYNKPYTYLIGWVKHDVWYYGVRYAKNCSTEDLWNTYFTSSKHVAEFRKAHGDPDVIQIRKIFNNRNDAIKYEQKIIYRAKLHLNERYLNKGAQRAFNIPSEILSERMIIRNKTAEARKRSKERMILNNPMKDLDVAERSRLSKTGVPNYTNRGDNNPMRKYAGMREQKSESMKGRFWCNDGTNNKFVRDLPTGYVKGRFISS
jgi:hypothetical protein